MILPPNDENSAQINAVLVAKDFYSVSGPPPDQLPVPLEDFLIPSTEKYASRQFGSDHRIIVEGRSWPKNLFRSMLVRDKHQSRILVHHSLNLCYTRFAVAIELGNVILGDNTSFNTTDIVAHLAGMLSQINPVKGTPLYGEALALPLAIELLMPMHHRQKMQGFIDSGADALTVATAFRVPEYVAEWSLAGGWQTRVGFHDIPTPPPVPPPDPPQ